MANYKFILIRSRLNIAVLLFSLYGTETFAIEPMQRTAQTGELNTSGHSNADAHELKNAQSETSGASIKQRIEGIFRPASDTDFRTVQLKQLSKFDYDFSKVNELPRVHAASTPTSEGSHATEATTLATHTRYAAAESNLSFIDAIHHTLARHPQISQSISHLAGQNANIDVAKSAYYPQISGGIGTGDMTTGERGRQVISLNATQLLYDFGQVKSSVDEQKAKLLLNQASVLVSIDDIAAQVASAIVNIKRYQESVRIANEQIRGVSRITEIAQLRAQAGISSQADPIQAQSYLEAARSNLISQQTQLSLYQERLRTLLGREVSHSVWVLPERLVKNSDIYADTQLNDVPKMIEAQAAVEVAKHQKKQVDLSRYPKLQVKGSMSQALNGVNPNNNKDNGYYNSVMLEATSSIYQGGATSSRSRAASFAEEAARAQVNNVYLDVVNQTRATRENIENKQRQLTVLSTQQAISIRTKELYQEQYKLGTRTVLDLLNAEQAIHSTNMQLENIRYDIYDSLVQFIAVTGKSRDVYQLNQLSIQGVEIQP